MWWGARKGGTVSGSPRRSPATEWIFVASMEASSSSAGRIPGSRSAIIVFPLPGGPTSSRLCSPAAATSAARTAPSCPRTSAKSGPGGSGTAAGPPSGDGTTARPSRAPAR